MDEEVKNMVPANLWTKIKSQCLNENPFISIDGEDHRIVQCPRCGTWDLDMNYTKLAVEPRATEWAATIRKCANCRHLFAFVE